jgi:DHA2 family multidrug resistance protein
MAADLLRQEPGKAALPVERRGLLTVGLMIATLLMVLDSTIANVAIPHMQASLGATMDEVSWVLTSYIIASAVTMPIIGWVADKFGSRELLLLCTGGFIVFSMLCGISTSIGEMVFFRVMQGVFGAGISPLAQTVMMDINPPERQVKALSVWATGIMIGPLIGPLLGGWLTESYNWRWVFFINVPLGIVSLLLLWALLPSRPRRERPFDLKGFFLLAAGLSMLQLFLDRGQSQDWLNSWEIRIEIMLCISFAWLYIMHHFDTPHPVIERATLRDRNFSLGLLLTMMIGSVMMSVMALLPLMMQSIYGHNVLSTGMLLAPRGAGLMLTMYMSGSIIQHFDVRAVIASGFAILAFSIWQMTGWTIEMGWMPMVVSGIIQGIGIGLVFVPLNALSFATLSPAYRTEGASISGLVRNIGGSIGISIMTALLARNLQISHQDLAGHIGPSSLMGINPAMLEAAGAPGNAAIQMIDGAINQQALMIAYLDDFVLLMWWSLVPIPFLFLFGKMQRRGAADHPPVFE